MVHWQRNVSSVVPQSKSKEVMAMAQAIHAQEDRQAALAKPTDVVAKLRATKHRFAPQSWSASASKRPLSISSTLRRTGLLLKT
jgi:transposase-like protein